MNNESNILLLEDMTTLTKERIEKLKKDNNGELSEFIQRQRDSKKIVFLLERIGYLPSNFNGKCLIPLLQNHNDNIRLLAVKNIGKLCSDSYLEALLKVLKQDRDSMVRREAVSAIGRMRSRKAIPTLLDILTNRDPKIVMQAIRGLLVFKTDPTVRKKLIDIAEHKNEMVQSIIRKEFNNGHASVSTLKHTEYPDFINNVVVHGEVREVLKHVPDDSIHLTFTSPPYYNARDYSIYQSYKDYLEFLASVFKEVYRVTKEGRFFVLNTSPIIIPRAGRQYSSKRYPIPFDIHPYLIEMGWEFIDDIIWLKPEASVKNRNAGFLQHRKPLAYKPNSITEMLMVYRKKTDNLIDWNIRQYPYKIINKSKVNENYETTNVWKIDPTFDKIHTAVFPIELCNRVVKYYSYEGDLVFDPFAGRGTLGKAAMNLNRHFFLTEINETYVNRIKEELTKNRDIFSTNFKQPRFVNMATFTTMAKAKNI